MQANTNKPVCLFMINGLGLGNSTRCYAVIEQLARHGVECHVLTSGNGLEFFKDKPGVASLHAMESFFYSTKNDQISAWQTFRSLGRLLRRAWIKQRQVEALLQHFRPQVLVTDSEYTIWPAKRRRIPVLALNNADVVVDEYFRRKNMPRTIAGHFWLVEFMDYLFHRFFVEAVISPAPVRLRARHKRIRRVGLILREEVRRLAPDPQPFPPPRRIKQALFMLSGSALGSHRDLPLHELPCSVAVVGRNGRSMDGRVVYHGRQMQNIPFLCAADLLVINGGFSAVSEALALNKPTLVMPLPRHAEQFVNALLVRDLGRGDITDENRVVDDVRRVLTTAHWDGFRPHVKELCLDGAVEAAEIIMSYLPR